MAKKSQINTKKPIYDVNWYNDKYQSNVVLRNWMVVITFLAVIGILMMVVASYYFVPLKSVSPFVIQIDEKTGVTEVIDSKATDEFTANELLIKYFGHKYILARENYNYLTYEQNRQLVRLMSQPDVYREYINYMEEPNGPKNVFGTHTDRKVELISSQVKFNKTTNSISVTDRMHVTETATQRRPYEYTISVSLQCHFDNSSNLTDDQRLVNPLAFVVEYYNVTKESYDDKKPQN